MSLQHASLTLSSSQLLPTEVAHIGTMFVSSMHLQLPPTAIIIPTALLSLALPSATAAATAITNSSDSNPRPGAENGECRLLGPFSLFIQGALGVLALLSLVYKRWRERPQRPVKIWAFDASKQVVGSMLLHIANLLMSMVSSGQLTVKAADYQANPCSFYLLNLAIDVSSGCVLSLFKSIEGMLTRSLIDDHRYSNTCCPTPPSTPRLFLHASRRSPRINSIRPLWTPAPRIMVAEAILHLFPWSTRYEMLRLYHISAMSMDYNRW